MFHFLCNNTFKNIVVYIYSVFSCLFVKLWLLAHYALENKQNKPLALAFIALLLKFELA